MENTIYFAHDWIISHAGIHHIRELFEKAEELGCVTYLGDAKQNAQEYLIQEIIIQLNSDQNLSAFIDYATSLGFTEWHSCSPPNPSILPTYINKIEGNIYGVWIDGLDARANVNKKLNMR